MNPNYSICVYSRFIRGPAVASASPSVCYSDHCSLGEEYPLVTLAYETHSGERGESIQRIVQEVFEVYPMRSVMSPQQRVIMFQAVRNNRYVDVKINLFPGELKTESRSLQIKDSKTTMLERHKSHTVIFDHLFMSFSNYKFSTTDL